MNKYAKCHRGYFKPSNPSKYVGDLNKIEFKSGLELAAFRQFDNHSSIINWSVENVKVPYRYNNKSHIYIVDMWANIKQRDGSIKEYLVEIKHKKNVDKPSYNKRKSKRYDEDLDEWMKNKAKWKAAAKYAISKNIKFRIITNELIYGKGL